MAYTLDLRRCNYNLGYLSFVVVYKLNHFLLEKSRRVVILENRQSLIIHFILYSIIWFKLLKIKSTRYFSLCRQCNNTKLIVKAGHIQ